MKNKKLQKYVITSLFAAVTCIATLVVHIPIPATKGYINIGDCFVIMGGIMLGPLFGMFSAGVGSALADIISGCIYYAPATFIIKALMAVVSYFIYNSLKKKKNAAFIISGLVSEIIMVLGYLLVEAFIFKYGKAAIAEVPINLIQGAAGIIMSFLLMTAIEKNETLKKILYRGNYK